MGGSVDTIKEKLDISEVLSGYVKLEKAGTSYKARCPFHNEKTPSFFVSPLRQSYYCFGCGAKGDIFTFVQEVEGLDFRQALKLLAEKAGVEIEHEHKESRDEKDKLFAVLEEAKEFFEKELEGNKEAIAYITSRGIDDEARKKWQIGYAPNDWRILYSHLQSLGYDKAIIIKAGLAKTSEDSVKEPYDVFRDRIIFPISDSSGRVIAFSGRALGKDTEPKYLNSPDTPLFTKSEVLYGLDKAKEHIRKKDYAILVEGQMDLVLSHQAGVNNTVAASGTAFTASHLERLKHLSTRIILAFDGDNAGEKAAERASELALSIGFEVKLANLPEGEDPADLAKKSPEEWKNVLRNSLPAVEFFFSKLEAREKDNRKLGKEIEKKILPMVKLIRSTIEQSHFISLIAKRTGIKEEVLWDDLKKVIKKEPTQTSAKPEDKKDTSLGARDAPRVSRKEMIEERLKEVRLWKKELGEASKESSGFDNEEAELIKNLSSLTLREDLERMSVELSRAENAKDLSLVSKLTKEIQELHKKLSSIEKEVKML